MSEIDLDKYITAFIRNAERSLRNGEIQIIMLWGETCGHCHAQFKYWARPLSHAANSEGMGMDIIEYEKLMRLVRSMNGDEAAAWVEYKKRDGTLTKGAIANIEGVANRILPIETTSPMGKKLILEAQKFADKVKTFNSPILKRPQDYEIRFTPTWLDYYTHENYGYGHHSERQLRDMLNLNSLSSRRERFKVLHSQVMNQDCDGVACGLDDRVKKIDPKQMR